MGWFVLLLQTKLNSTYCTQGVGGSSAQWSSVVIRMRWHTQTHTSVFSGETAAECTELCIQSRVSGRAQPLLPCKGMCTTSRHTQVFVYRYGALAYRGTCQQHTLAHTRTELCTLYLHTLAHVCFRDTHLCTVSTSAHMHKTCLYIELCTLPQACKSVYINMDNVISTDILHRAVFTLAEHVHTQTKGCVLI